MTPHIADKPFADTLLARLRIDPQAGIVGNVMGNLNDTVGTMHRRQQERLSSMRMMRAISEHQRDRELRQQTAPAWREVPQQVQQGFNDIWPTAQKVAVAFPGIDLFHHREHDLWHAQCDPFEQPDIDIPVSVDLEPPPGDGWIHIKRATWLKPVGDAWGKLHRSLGGPNPLLQTLLGGAVGAGLGYGGGWLLKHLLPDAYFDKDKSNLGAAGAVLGGTLGAAPGLIWGAKQYSPDADNAKTTFQDRGAGWLSSYPFSKKAEMGDAGSLLFARTIPVDAFNSVVWNDVGAPVNPYGTHNPFGNNEQPLQTPLPVAAAVTGTLYGAAAAAGGRHSVSPWDVAVTAAQGGAAGLFGGLVLGKTLGVLAGLQPAAQQQLQQMGLWGGMLTGAVTKAFSGP